MSKRSKQFLTFLLYAAVVSNFGCTTTTYTSTTHAKTTYAVEPSQGAMGNYGTATPANKLVVANNVSPAKASKKQAKICPMGVLAQAVQLNNIVTGNAPIFTITP